MDEGLAPCPLNHANLEVTMQPEVTPTEARSGVVTGRVFLVLTLSSIGAIAALALAWYLLVPHG